MSAHHTPGPLYVGDINHKMQRADIDTATKDGRLGYSTWRGLARTYGCEDFPSIGSEIMEANARRIVACVNACEGVRTEHLENNLPIVELVARYNEALREIDALKDEIKSQQDKIRGLAGAQDSEDVFRIIEAMQLSAIHRAARVDCAGATEDLA